MKLSPERRAELINELHLRVLFRDKLICKRYGISRSTLARLQREALDQHMTQNAPQSIHVLVLNGDMPLRRKTA